MKNIIQKELSFAITGVSFEVAKRLRRFCRERQYADCFEQVLTERQIQYKREVEIKDIRPSAPAGNKADFIINGAVLVDLKAKRFVTKDDYYQMQRYLNACDLELGLIINFRNSAIKPLRVLNSGYSGRNSGHSERVRGFSLVEMLFYVALLSLALVAVMQTIVVVTRSYTVLRAAQHIEQESAAALERMLREARDAHNTADAGSTFGAHPGRLFLNTTSGSGSARTVEFYLDSGKLALKEDGAMTGFLTSSTTNIQNLVFRKITTTRSQGVKIELTMQSGVGHAARSENFYGTAVLRDSY